MKSKMFLLSCTMALTSAGYAQTWVSASVGSDSNSCARTSPCRTFQRAVNVTPAWGQLNVLDPGDYSSVVISQAVTIDGGGFASNVAASGTAITVQAPSGQIVQLRNLTIHGNGAYTGISHTSGGQLHIDNLKINGFAGNCIAVSTSVAMDLIIKDTSIDNCSNYGINISTTAALTATITNTHVHFANGGLATNAGTISISGSTFTPPSPGTYDVGISTVSGANATIMIDNCQVSDYNVAVYAPGGTIQISRSTFMNNNYAVDINGGAIISNGNNSFLNNANIGAFTKTVALQ